MNLMIPPRDARIRARPLRPLRAAVICGSSAPHSHTRCIGEAAADALRTCGVPTIVLDLAEETVSPPSRAAFRDPSERARAEAFVAAIEEADVVVLATPTYHGSYSGALKSAIDHLGKRALAGKVVGLTSHAGNPVGAAQPLDHLRAVTANLGGHAVGLQVSTCDADFSGGADGDPRALSPTVVERMDRLASELVLLADALAIAVATARGSAGPPSADLAGAVKR